MQEQSIFQLQQAMQGGDISSLQLCEYYLERIERYDWEGPKLGAVIEINLEARKQAERLDDPDAYIFVKKYRYIFRGILGHV